MGDNPNPFESRPSPFMHARMYPQKKTEVDDDMCKGVFWEPRDRECKFYDIDLLQRAWGDTFWKRPYEDLLNPGDDKFDWYDGQVEMQIHLMSKVQKNNLDDEPWSEYAEFLQAEYDSITVRKPLPILERHYTECEDGIKEVPQQRTPEEAQRKAGYDHRVDRFIDECIDKRDYIKITFIDAEGTKHRVYGVVGESLLNVARRWDVPIDGLCQGGDPNVLYGEGPMCHLCQMDISPQYAHLLPKIRRQEEYHFNRFWTMCPTSRLGCQIKTVKEMDGMVVQIPAMIPSATNH